MSQRADALARPAAGPITRDVSIDKTTVVDTLAVLGEVLLPTIAKGVIIRREAVLRVAEWLQLDRRAIRRMQHIRNKYGAGPVMLRMPGRSLALLLNGDDVGRVLDESPEPFATETMEKRAALRHFEPKGALISHGAERADRRRYNEEALQSDNPRHQMADAFVQVVASEARRLRSRIPKGGELTWSTFSETWFRVVRRVVFGDAAAEDHELSGMMASLRYSGNWAFLRPRREQLRASLHQKIRDYLKIAEPNSLAGYMAHIPTTSQTAPEQQVPQWLFAFDPAGMTVFRSLALLATHPEHGSREMPFLRATMLEALRLWPTTPLLLRETTQETEWRNGVMPRKTGVIIFAPFFHRDDELLPYADRFAPELWMDDSRTQRVPLVPFSAGPAICPGRHVVLLVGSAMLSELLDGGDVRLRSHAGFRSGPRLQATLNHFGLRFGLS